VTAAETAPADARLSWTVVSAVAVRPARPDELMAAAFAYALLAA
jgi:hypothetical protein